MWKRLTFCLAVPYTFDGTLSSPPCQPFYEAFDFFGHFFLHLKFVLICWNGEGIGGETRYRWNSCSGGRSSVDSPSQCGICLVANVPNEVPRSTPYSSFLFVAQRTWSPGATTLSNGPPCERSIVLLPSSLQAATLIMGSVLAAVWGYKLMSGVLLA